MATPEEPGYLGASPSMSITMSITSHDTALCIIPPRSLWTPIDRLRMLYDKAYEKWPPHLNIVYPFVRPESLEQAVEEIAAGLKTWRQQQGNDELPRIRLDSSGVFSHRRDNTIFLCDGDVVRGQVLRAVRAAVLAALGHADDHGHRLHLTVAQTDDVEKSAHKFLCDKVRMLPNVEWEVDRLHILVRERPTENGFSVMKEWGAVDLHTGAVSRLEKPTGFYGGVSSAAKNGDEDASKEEGAEATPSFFYDDDARCWRRSSRPTHTERVMPRELRISSYNVLAEFEYPPRRDRYPVLVRNILSREASAEVLVLQEMTDDFLSYLLQDEGVRAAYPHVSHGPPHQDNMEPLPSFLNIVLLSNRPFDWASLAFARQHKGAVVATFPDLGKWEDGEFLPAVLATVHFTHGLTDGAVSAKGGELQRVLSYLADSYEGHPWILAGDFNVTTSRNSIEAALKKGDISPQTVANLSRLETMLEEAGFMDSWAASTGRNEYGNGEDGATFDPAVNGLTAKMVGSGLGNRPQRYDRILVRGEGVLDVASFNMFGLVNEETPHEGGDKLSAYGSDHWGIRSVLTLEGGVGADSIPSEISSLVVPVEPRKASGMLEDVQSLRGALSVLGAFPTEDEAVHRQEAFDQLKALLLENPARDVGEGSSFGRLRSSLIVVPVGSYGLGVWTPTSDIDCMCIGPYSSATFMALAVQRIRKAAGRGFKLLRRVRANTGTMLELEVQGVKMDLQYCAATAVAERWPDVLDLPAGDPVFALPAQTLGKLKAARDLDYLRRSLPDLAKFRLAHRAVRMWAKSRGIYSPRFGYLGGIHISVLLARVCKILARDVGPGVSVADILVSFFSHYAAFDWQKDLVFDPFFHNKKLNYHRTSREPLAILGFFPPALNTAHAATVPSVRAIAGEFRRADTLLAQEGMTWDLFFRGGNHPAVAGPLSGPATPVLPSGAADFLASYKSYIKFELSYWGLSLPRGSQFVGWFESRCPLVLVDISRRLPSVLARMWPERFVEAANSSGTARAGGAKESNDDYATGGEELLEYQGCYLVGLEQDQDQDGGSPPSKEDQRAAAGALQTLLQRFEQLIRGDDKYYDAKCMWMSASVVRRGELGDLAVDTRSWGEYTIGEDEEDEEEDEEGGDSPGDEDELDDELVGLSITRKEKKKKKGKKIKDAATGSVPPAGTGRKFRTAADVISRLRWDPSLDSRDYIVGYEDRFKGAMEKALEEWKSDQTDENFVPQHRILFFKRKSDGVVVWERRTRKDELFGSG